MQVRQLIVTGLVADICVLMTAMDAYLRSYRIWVPSDCTAAESEEAQHWALKHMRGVLKCGVRARTEAGSIHWRR
jgi:nicotinamidase-related amidase